MRNSGLGSMHAFAIVGAGGSTEIESGDLALQHLGDSAKALRLIRGIERSVLSEQVMPGATAATDCCNSCETPRYMTKRDPLYDWRNSCNRLLQQTAATV